MAHETPLFAFTAKIVGMMAVEQNASFYVDPTFMSASVGRQRCKNAARPQIVTQHDKS